MEYFNQIIRFLHQPFIFITKVLKKWIFWLFLILDVVGMIVQYLFPQFYFPQFVYVILAIIGIVWASYDVYNELLNDYQKIIVEHNLTEIVRPLKSELSILAVEGNVYSFDLEEPQMDKYDLKKLEEDDKRQHHYSEDGVLFIDGEPFYYIPKCFNQINIRIENTGEIQIDILAFGSRWSKDKKGVFLSSIDVFDVMEDKLVVNNETIKLPLTMKPGDIIVCSLQHYFYKESIRNEFQFAANLITLQEEIYNNFSIDTLDTNKLRKVYSHLADISTRPLRDLYVAQWQKYSQHELLRIYKKA